MNQSLISRRSLFRGTLAATAAGVLQACAAPGSSSNGQQDGERVLQPIRRTLNPGKNVLRVVAPSGFAADPNRIALAFGRLERAGFQLDNQSAAYRRYQRFAGTDSERVDDLQAVASGRVATPKVLMGLRGGYGAMRLLPQIDFVSLGARMRERETLFFGFSDVCALQLALLAQGNMCSFAGPMVYSEFGKPMPSVYTISSFIEGSTKANNRIFVQSPTRSLNIGGTFWGGNLSMVAALCGTPYLPDVPGGILFLEDVGEQPYRIERMLQTLYLAGVLSKQQAIVLGDFRMGNIRDVYDASYNFAAVMATVSRLARVPVLTGFPFGHIANKSTFPLGAQAQIQGDANGYSVSFSGYPTLDASSLALETLLPTIEQFGVTSEDSSDTEAAE